MSTLADGIKAELVASTVTAGYLAGTGSDPDRIYPLVIPQKKPSGASQLPCLVYQVTSVERTSTYCETIKLVRTRMSLDSYSDTYDEAREVAAAVRGVLLDFAGMLGGLVDVRLSNLESEFDILDIEPGLYRVNQSWVFWHLE